MAREGLGEVVAEGRIVPGSTADLTQARLGGPTIGEFGVWY